MIFSKLPAVNRRTALHFENKAPGKIYFSVNIALLVQAYAVKGLFKKMKKELLNKFSDASEGKTGKYEQQACVAVLLRGKTLDHLEIGFIQRAIDDNDRWSGHIAFPGGRTEDIDESSLDTALRETHEEIGIMLSKEDFIGTLKDIKAHRSLNVGEFYIRPLVFYISQNVTPQLDPNEVAEFFWFPINELLNPHRKTQIQMNIDSKKVDFPAIDLNHSLPLWGLTYLMIQNLIETLQIAAHR
jgi:8-oxo-dGTP pyrophosphatase MutT (NUDIX family)